MSECLSGYFIFSYFGGFSSYPELISLCKGSQYHQKTHTTLVTHSFHNIGVEFKSFSSHWFYFIPFFWICGDLMQSNGGGWEGPQESERSGVRDQEREIDQERERLREKEMRRGRSGEKSGDWEIWRVREIRRERKIRRESSGEWESRGSATERVWEREQEKESSGGGERGSRWQQGRERVHKQSLLLTMTKP